jgi:amidase
MRLHAVLLWDFPAATPFPRAAMTDRCLEPAHVLLGQMRERALTAADLLERHAARLAQVNPAINAVVATNLDAARARARAADAALARGESWGPLHGLPMTIKDTLEVEGMPTTSGAPALKDYRPKHNAPAVQKLVDAGAVIFGKTNVPLYGGDVQAFNKVYGTTRNPWNLERTSGGSSGGAAAALAAGLTSLELGSDIGGSIRTPAHFCGVYGHKPSSGIVSSRGHIPGPPGTVHEADMVAVGPLARSASDLALALSVVAGPVPPASAGWRLELPRPRHASLAMYRVHAWLDDPYCPVDPAVRSVLEAAVEKIRAAGCRVTTGAPAGVSLAEIYEHYFALLCAVFGGGLPQKLYDRARLAGAFHAWLGRDRVNTAAGFLSRATLSHRDWVRLHERRERLRLALEGFFGDTDVLLMPVTRTTAPVHLQDGTPYERLITVDGRSEPYASQFVWIALATLAGLPATSAPVGHAADGLPVGLQITGGHLQDLTTIDFARLLAAQTGGFTPPAMPSATMSRAVTGAVTT